MAKIPGAVNAGVMPQPRVSPWEQLLIGLIGSAPQIAMGVMDQRRAGRAEQRQVDQLTAADTAGGAQLAQLVAEARANVQDPNSAALLAGLNQAVPGAFEVGRIGNFGTVPKAMNQQALAPVMQAKPGAVAQTAGALSQGYTSGLQRQGARMQMELAQKEEARAVTAAAQATERFGWDRHTFEFEASLEPEKKRLAELQVLNQEAALKNNALEASRISGEINRQGEALRQRALEFAVGIRDRNLQMVSDIAGKFGVDPASTMGIFAELAPLFGLDADIGVIADEYTNTIATGADPKNIRAFLDINPARFTGAVLQIPNTTVDQLLTAAEAGEPISDYWGPTVELIKSTNTDPAARDLALTQAKAFFEATASYYRQPGTFVLPGNPSKWRELFKGFVSRARDARGIVNGGPTTTAPTPSRPSGIVSIDPALQGTWVGDAYGAVGSGLKAAGNALGSVPLPPTFQEIGLPIVDAAAGAAKRDLSRGPSLRGSFR